MADTTATPRPFTDVLAEIRRGQLADELSRELHTVIDRAVAHDATGELTLKIKVKRVGEQQIVITGDVTTKLPKAAPPASIFYVDLQGNATRHDPNQQRMFQED